MINFLNNWVEQIAITIIIVSIFELILPNGSIKKYIKVVLGIYVIFCLISPFVNSSKLYEIKDINIEQYANLKQSKTTSEEIDSRLEELYIEQLKNNIKTQIEEKGYKVKKCDVKANLSSQSQETGISKIELIINKENIEKIQIGTNNESQDQNKEEIEQIKEELANYYQIDKNIIKITIK